jgi:hypothetical protein
MAALMNKPLKEEDKLSSLRELVREAISWAMRKKHSVEEELEWIRRNIIEKWDDDLKLKGLNAVQEEVDISDYFYSAARRVWIERVKEDESREEEKLPIVRFFKQLRKKI